MYCIHLTQFILKHIASTYILARVLSLAEIWPVRSRGSRAPQNVKPTADTDRLCSLCNHDPLLGNDEQHDNDDPLPAGPWRPGRWRFFFSRVCHHPPLVRPEHCSRAMVASYRPDQSGHCCLCANDYLAQ